MNRFLIRFSRALWPALLIAVLVLSACGKNNDNNGQGTSCSTRDDCASGERCTAEGVCTTDAGSCEFTSDCGLDEYCAEGTCELAACDDDSACGNSAICENGACRIGCREDAECDSGEACSDSNVCVVAGCTPDSCPAFQACDDSLDPPACTYTGDCNRDAQCVAYAQQLDDGEEYICSEAEQRCVVKPPCGDDSDCRIGDICEPRQGDGRLTCRRGCRDNDGCRSGQICDLNNLVCTEGCDTVDDCPNDGNTYACADLVCVQTCENRNDCDVEGYVCTGSPRVCQPCGDSNECPATEFCDLTLEEDEPGLGRCTPLPPTCPADAFGDNHDQNNPYVIPAVPFMTDMNDAPLFCRENQGGEWFSVTAAAGDVIEVELTYDNNVGNLDVALRRPQGEEIIAAQEPPTIDGGSELLRFGVDLSGTFLIHVRGTIVDDNLDYGLRVDVAPPPACTDDVLEPNGPGSPAPLPAAMPYMDLEVCGGDADFYTLSIEQNQVVTIVTEAPTRLGNIDMFLRDPDGNQVASAEGRMDKEMIELALDDAGDYELEVRVVSGVGNIEYNLDWRQRDNNCADSFEVNDTCPAQPISPATYDNLNVCDDADWYTIDLLPLQTVTVTATYDRAVSAGDLDITLIGPNDCATLAEVGTEQTIQNTTQVQEEIVYQAQQGGSFNLQVFLFSGIQAEYDLDIQVSDGPACVDDAQEPNDDTASAVMIDATLAATGDDNIITGLKMCDTDEDWYQIDLAEGQEIRWDVQFEQSRGDLDAELIGPGDVVVDIGDSSTDNESVGYTVGNGEAGTYYLKVTSKFAARNDYWVLTYLDGTGPADPVCPDQFENNDDRANATMVADGSYGLIVCGSPSDDDWFSTTLSAGETLNVDLTFGHANGNVDLYVFDDSGSTQPVAQSRTTTDNESVSYTSARDQTVVWRVEAASSQAAIPYDMDVSVTGAPVCQDDQFAGNDASGSAAPVDAPGLYSRLQLCSGSEDWYAFDLENGRQSEVFLNFDGVAANLEVEVLDPSLTVVGSGTTTNSDESVVFTPTSTGTYYARVYGVANARLEYDLLLYTDTNGDGTPDGPADRICPDPYEDNDSQNNPAPIPAGFYDDLLLCSGGDQDYFEVFVPAGATLTATATFDGSAGDINLRLLSALNTSVDDSLQTMSDSESVTVTNAGMGAAYKIHVFGLGTFTSYYELDVALQFADTCMDDTVAGGSQATAGSLSAGQYDLALCEGEEDWFDLGSVTSIDARLEFKNELGNVDVELIDSTGVVASSVGDVNTEELAASGLSGQHWLRVFAKDGAFVRNNYDLWFAKNGTTPAAPYCPDAYERNDDIGSASNIATPNPPQVSGLNACGADQDWYVTSSLNITSHEIAVFYDHATGSDVSLKMWHGNDDPMVDSPIFDIDTTDDDALATFTPTMTGAHIVLVENTAASPVSTPYEFLLGRSTMYSSTAACPEDSYEPNESVFQTGTLDFGTTTALGFCGTSPNDYFRFTAPNNGDVTVTVMLDDSKFDVGLRVENANTATVVGQSNANAGNRESVTFTATAGTDYVIGVLPASGQGPYFLRIE